MFGKREALPLFTNKDFEARLNPLLDSNHWIKKSLGVGHGIVNLHLCRYVDFLPLSELSSSPTGLSRRTLALLDQLKPLRAPWPFHTPPRPRSESALNAALRRLGYVQEKMTAHGFRAMIATLLLAMSVWNADATERRD
jgi:hypothetical protein